MKEYNPMGHPGEPFRLHDEGEQAPFALQPGDVVEVPLLLSARQMKALEEAAHHRGLTAGEMVRRLLQEFIAGPSFKSPPCTSKVAAC
jgi:hypothetical protein